MTMSAPSLPGPGWVSDWPGRYTSELDALRRAGTSFKIDEEKLAAGELVIDIDWLAGTRHLRLKAVYPESFPWTRPQVFLDAPMADLPEHHCNPISGELCLLGRDTKQWNVQWTLQELLERQLEAALDRSGDEDPQAEPVEVWWNGVSPPGAGFCLVDSSWRPERAQKGTLKIAYAYKSKDDLRMRACAIEASAPGFSASFEPPVPGLKNTTTVPWMHLDRPLQPDRAGVVLCEAINIYGLMPSQPFPLESGIKGQACAFSYPMETAHGVTGTGWLFAYVVMRPEAQRKKLKLMPEVLQTLRAGSADLAIRDPSAAPLVGKRIVVAGIGAIGAPIALGLARSGCSRLGIIDHDTVEPGNSIRWVAGYPTWGLGKTAALKALIETHHPACEVDAYPLVIGGAGEKVAAALAGADLVIDATAAYGPGMWLGAHCKKIGVPLLTAMAWADDAVEGGLVGVHRPTSGCPHCLDFLEARGVVPSLGPRGAEPRLQPAGCGERTFRGSGHDLQEISLQALRMVPAALSETTLSVVAALSFEATTFGLRLPRWDLYEAPPADECGCIGRG